MAIQWHPLFAELLRPLLDEYYEIQTGVPVGDLPREADFVLLRRKSRKAIPFVGVWKHLTPWNVLEYKGPSGSARLTSIDLLVEVGLGIQRRFNEKRGKDGQSPIEAKDVSFWYLSNHFGKRFLAKATSRLGVLENCGEGLWRGRVLERPIFLVSCADLPVELDSVPFHILANEAPEKEQAMVRLVMQDPTLLQHYTQFLESLHPDVLEEIMAGKPKLPKFHLKRLVDLVGMKEVVRQVGTDQVLQGLIDQVGVDGLIDQIGLDGFVDQIRRKKKLEDFISRLTPAEREKLKPGKE